MRDRVREISSRLSNGQITEKQALKELARLRYEARKTQKAMPELLSMTKKDVAEARTASKAQSSDKSSSTPSKSTGIGLLDTIKGLLGL